MRSGLAESPSGCSKESLRPALLSHKVPTRAAYSWAWRNAFAILFVSMVLYKQTAALRNLEKVVAKFESGFTFTMKIELV